MHFPGAELSRKEELKIHKTCVADVLAAEKSNTTGPGQVQGSVGQRGIWGCGLSNGAKSWVEGNGIAPPSHKPPERAQTDDPV